MAFLESIVTAAANWIWGLPLVLLITGSGLFFFLFSRFLPFRHLPHGIAVLTGRHDQSGDPGLISHFQALSVALAATIGMGNIAGVAIAISVGGPGAIFWMWMSAILGMATKYFTCTLAVMYRGRDSEGVIQGGPMYVIIEGLGRKWKPLAIWFCVAGMAGCLPVFNANQLTQAVRDIMLIPAGVQNIEMASFIIGLILMSATAAVIFGGLKRISHVVTMIVPFMVVIYVVAVVGIILINIGEVPKYFTLIFTDAFSANFFKGEAMFGGALGGLILLGVRRAAFSNEAGLGTAPMAHGAAKTSEPVHEGLVAMLGPVIDTLIICTMTALAILMTGVWQTTESNGVTLTANAFESAYPGFGGYILLLCILSFGGSSLISYSYFGKKCFSFLFGVKRSWVYNVIYVATILMGAVSSMGLILNFIDFSFAMMAIPTVSSALILSPKVVAASKEYFARQQTNKASS
ncbi:alanine/glycine:cation symporter family protein [Hyphococcus formosus]|uniref:alanine/glycine:cation symporter family protein n=1 Tax=Hyphococcus formosus TaxID=3143534 RepID=UPI00398B5E86